MNKLQYYYARMINQKFTISLIHHPTINYAKDNEPQQLTKPNPESDVILKYFQMINIIHKQKHTCGSTIHPW